MSEQKKRYELKVCSNHTVMEGLNPPADYIKKCKLSGISGVAFTDRMTVSAYPEILEASKADAAFLPIYGVELVVENDVLPNDFAASFCVSVLIKDSIGLKCIYRILSAAAEGEKRSVLFSALLSFREHLLLGSAADGGAFYHCTAASDLEDAFSKIAGYFDYLEITPAMSRELVRRIDALGVKLDIPVAAVSDARYCYRAQEEHHTALTHANRLNGEPVTPKPLCSAKQLLRHFAFLGSERADAAVYGAPAMIAANIGKVELFDRHFHRLSPQCDSISSALQAACKKRYGENIPGFVKDRLNQELAYFTREGLLGHLQTLYQVTKSMKGAYIAGSYGGTLLCFLLGISPIDPLPAYLHCPNCGSYTALSDEEAEDMYCFCPHCMTINRVLGFDIPFSTFTASSDYHQLWIVCERKDAKSVEATLGQMYPPSHMSRIGAFRTMPFARFRKFYQQLNREHENCMPLLPREEGFDRISSLGGGVGLFAHDLGEYLLTPAYLTVCDLTAICKETGKRQGKHLTAFGAEDFENGGCTVLKCTHSDAVEMLNALTAQSKYQIDEQTDYTSEAMELLAAMQQNDFALLPEEYLTFLPTLSSYFPLDSYAALVDILSIGHGSKLWIDNFALLLQEERITPDEMFTCCEELYDLLCYHGMDEKTACDIVDAVRIGEGNALMTEEMTDHFKQLDLPEWLPEVLGRIRRLHTMMYAIAEADVLCRLLWYAIRDEALYRKICLKGE